MSGVLEVVRLLDCAKKITRDSVFVDFGCSVGGVCMYVASRFGCKVIGIEKDANTVTLGERYLLNHGDTRLRRLCSLIHADFVDIVDGAFLWKNGVTHVFAYDIVFSPDAWHALFRVLASGPPLVGVSCARKRDCPLPESFNILQKSAKPVALTGSPSKFKVVSWTNF